MIFSSPPLGRWWRTLPTIFSILWLVRPRPHAKYLRTIYPYIDSGFNYLTGMTHMYGPNLVSQYPPSAWRLSQYVYDCTFSASVWHSISFQRSLLFYHSVPFMAASHVYHDWRTLGSSCLMDLAKGRSLKSHMAIERKITLIKPVSYL